MSLSVTRSADKTEWWLRLPYDQPPLSANDRHANGKAERRLQTAVHEAVEIVAKSEFRHQFGYVEPWQRVSVELVYYPRDNRRRDPDNMAATLKPALDALVSARVIPDDKATHVVRTSQRIVLRDDDPYNRPAPELWLRIVNMEAAEDLGHPFPTS
jgi:crossover junction endodeoxyribonuclease RusA